MVLFKSCEANIDVPLDLTIWEWLFESKEYSTLCKPQTKPFGAFIDADTKDRLDWAEVKAKSTSLSSYFVQNLGLKAEETVSIFSGNSIWYPVCILAATRVGARVNGCSTILTVGEIVHTLKLAKTTVILTTLSALPNVAEAASQVGIDKSRIFVLGGTTDGFKSVSSIIEAGQELPSQSPYYRLPNGKTNAQICSHLNFSSGTTGLPKAVLVSHHNLIAQCYFTKQMQPDMVNMSKLAVLPLYHITGTWRFCLLPILVNVDCVMLPAFSMPALLDAIVHFRIREVTLVPPLVLRFARDDIVNQYDLSHVERFSSSAAPISVEVLKLLEKRFPWTTLRTAYGATECPMITSLPPSHMAFKHGASVGKLLPNTVAKIIDPSGNELGPGQSGEIWIKAPQVTMGYLDNEKATRESFDADGFYHTGDVGHFDHENLLYITDRIKEMIKVKGIQVAPAELEDLLHGHKHVVDAAVIGQPDLYAGELPKAFIVLRPGIVPSTEVSEEIMQYVKDNKARYKWIKNIEFVSTIPKSAAGKILRYKLRQMEKDRNLEAKALGTAPRVTVTELVI